MGYYSSLLVDQTVFLGLLTIFLGFHVTLIHSVPSISLINGYTANLETVLSVNLIGINTLDHLAEAILEMKVF